MIEVDEFYIGIVIVFSIFFGWLLGGVTAIWLGYRKP